MLAFRSEISDRIIAPFDGEPALFEGFSRLNPTSNLSS